MEENEAKPSDVEEASLKKRVGFLEGKIKLPENLEEFNRKMDREIEELFYEGEIFPPEQPSSESEHSDADRSGNRLDS